MDDNTSKILKQVLRTKVEFDINNNKNQVGFINCGLFAIANCVSLPGNNTPSSNFDQAKMRQRLVDCIESLNLTMFPCIQ